MKYLLDTHILLWMLFDPDKLSKKVRNILEDDHNELFVSVVSLWEISLKYQLKKLIISDVLPEAIIPAIKESDINIKELSEESAISFYKLGKRGNRDPFERMIIWESIRNNYVLLSKDSNLEEYRKYGLEYTF